MFWFPSTTYISGTGQLDFSEFLSVFTKNQQIDSELEMKKAFAVFDKDEDGFISVEDLKSVLTNLDQNFTEQEINDMVRETDTDGDGKISYNGEMCNTGLPLIIHLKIPGLFPDFSLTFYSFPYPLTDTKEKLFIFFTLMG